jgi:hypothetical protein
MFCTLHWYFPNYVCSDDDDYYYYYYYYYWYNVAVIVTKLFVGRSGVRISAGLGDFPLVQNVHAVSGAYPAPYTMDTTSFSGVKRPVRGVNLPTPI